MSPSVKGVIVAAGYGSRFLPATKTIPKEMLPLLDKPAISFIIDEFQAAGIQEILIITSRRKKGLDDFFDREVELEEVFRREGKLERLKAIEPPSAKIFFVRQQEMNGTGNAILLAKPFTADAPFVVAYPDDLIFAKTGLAQQLIDAHQQTGASVLAVKDIGNEDVSRYAVVATTGPGNPYPVGAVVEKPSRDQKLGSLVSYGRYLFTAEVYEHLEHGLLSHTEGEYYHIGAINRLAAAGRLVALDFEGERLDTGEPLGFLEATCKYALMRPEWAETARALFAKLGQPESPQ